MTTATVEHITREGWLMAAVDEMTPWFEHIAADPIPVVRVSCAWAKRARANSIGWCWHAEVSADSVNELQISPELGDPVKVLATLLHEMVHASDNGKSGHKGYFRKTALALGLEGKMTATVAGAGLKVKLQELAAKLGEYPHAALSPGGRRVGKQGTRMLKVECVSCGYTVRTTRKWLEIGTPSCPCGWNMEEIA